MTTRLLLLLACALAPVPRVAQEPEPGAPGEAETDGAPARFVATLPGTTATLDMVLVPAGELVVGGRGGDRERTVAVDRLWFSATEVPWEVFDAFVFEELEDGAARDVDALARPTVPYIAIDRGFGHDGYPALSMSYGGALAFCEWLSARTGRAWRLPTEWEWEHACRAGSTAAWSVGDDPAALDAVAWFRDNADRSTHPVGEKEPNAFGLFDVHGNVGEWATGDDGEPVLCGGAYSDRAERLRCDARRRPHGSWNASDPNLPKSVWWLADAPFVGLRLVCEPAADE